MELASTLCTVSAAHKHNRLIQSWKPTCKRFSRRGHRRNTNTSSSGIGEQTACFEGESQGVQRDAPAGSLQPRRAVLASLAALAAYGLGHGETRASGATPCAVVTGACGGIGGEVAAGLVAQGFDVVCACRTVEQSKAAAAKLNARYLEVFRSKGDTDLLALQTPSPSISSPRWLANI
eukprot:1193391-Prorocentrum_minimum.AAC.1